jgi:hypothetical protein
MAKKPLGRWETYYSFKVCLISYYIVIQLEIKLQS